MKKLNKALSITLATLVSMPVLADKLNIEDFSFGGRVEARGVVADSDFDDKSRVRFNGQGKHQVNDDITAVAKFEFELTQEDNSADTEVKNNTRYLYVGVETAYGTVTYGTQDNAVTYLTDFTDMAEVFSGSTNEYITASGDRAEDTILYSVAKGDFKFNASANLVEVSTGYAATEALDTEADSSDVYMVGARYTQGDFLLSGLVQTGSLADADFNAFDAYAAYAFGQNNVNISYNYYSADDLYDIDINYVAFEYAHYIDNMAVYASYKVALSTDTSAGHGNNDNADEFQVGARYSF